jgi:hypothetical protein
MNLLISAFQVAGITGMSHQYLTHCFFYTYQLALSNRFCLSSPFPFIYLVNFYISVDLQIHILLNWL